MTGPSLLGATAAALQLFSYGIYVRLTLTDRCAPNGVSWLMWSYGTAVVVFVQADLGTPLSVMLTPIFCLACQFIVTFRAISGCRQLVLVRQDWLVLSTDVFILFGYLACIYGVVPSSPESRVNFVLLPAISSVLSVWPIIRTTYQDARRERPWPWLISAMSDALVAAAVLAEGLPWQYLVYPLVTMMTQLPVAILALGWQPGTAGLRQFISRAD